MSALIKAAAAHGCRPLGTDREHARPPGAPHVPDHQLEIAHLREQLAMLQSDHKQHLAQARSDGIAEGRRAAIDEFDHSRTEALDRLETACNRALEHFSRSILSVEKLATLIAQAVLDQLLLGDAHYLDIARQVIAARIKEIDRSSVVRVLVSAEDFPDQVELDQLADLCGIDQTVIKQMADLKIGQCRIELTLGVLDVGLRQQWDRLNQHMSDVPGPGDHS